MRGIDDDRARLLVAAIVDNLTIVFRIDHLRHVAVL